VISLETANLQVTVDPKLGGTVTSIIHKAQGLSVLGTVPWTPQSGPAATIAAPDENAWLPYYSGGWPLLFPNGGDACTFDGVFHGFHGEASLAVWDVDQTPERLRLHRRFETVPVEMERLFTVEGEALTIRESVTMHGRSPVTVIWGHHPTFGSDLLAEPFEIATAARRVVVDDRFDPSVNPLQPGADAKWPEVPGKSGSFRLDRPHGPMAAMAYLLDFATPQASIRRLDGAIAVDLTWDGAVFPCAWLWIELEGTQEAPWAGKTRLIGIEPNTTWPGNGLLDTHRRGARLLTLHPNQKISAWVRLRAFKPDAAAVSSRSSHVQ
jgi:galactose mutarotase-like enzyme